MSQDYEDDGEVLRPKRPPRLRKDGQPDQRKPPKAHQFKPGQSGNKAGRKKAVEPTQSASSARRGRANLVEKVLAIEVDVNGIDMTMEELILRRHAKAAAEGSVASMKALLMARERGPTAQSESPAQEQQRRELSQILIRTLDSVQSLKKMGLLSEQPTELGVIALKSWIYEEQQRRISEGIDAPPSTSHGGKVRKA